MFSSKIVDSDAFLDMPQTSQLLYFHLAMRTDDDGFVGNPKKIMRMIGSAENDLSVLFSKKFIIGFDSGIIVIKHHRINNNWDSYNCKRTQYLDEFKQLYIKENGSYTLDKIHSLDVQSEFSLKTDCFQSLEENRIEENRIEENNTMSVITDAFNQFWIAYPKKELKKKTEEIWKRKKLDTKTKEILDFIEKAKQTDRWKKGFIKQPPAFLNGECWNDDLANYNDKYNSRAKSVAIIK